jgi:DNA-binding CsgD family transcriptional regulator
MSRLRRLPATGPRSQAAAGISRQEHRVLMHLSDGCANKEIARLLDVSESAVKFHLRNLFRKLQVKRRAALLEHARARGLLS